MVMTCDYGIRWVSSSPLAPLGLLALLRAEAFHRKHLTRSFSVSRSQVNAILMQTFRKPRGRDGFTCSLRGTRAKQG